MKGKNAKISNNIIFILVSIMGVSVFLPEPVGAEEIKEGNVSSNPIIIAHRGT